MIRSTTRMMLALGLLLALLSACSSDQKDPALEAANELHLEAMAISDSLEGYLSSAEGANWDSLRQVHTTWEDNLVEVPGFEHAHDHGDDHDHNHDHDHDNTLINLPPAEMKQLQQALRDEVAQMLALAKQWELTPVPTDSLSQ